MVLNSGNTQYVIAESNNSLVLQTSSTQASTTELAKQAWKFLDVYTYTQLSSVTFSDLNIVHGQYAQAHISAKNSNNGSGNPTMATIADFTYEQLGSIVSVDLSGVFLGIKTGQRVIRATHKLTGVTTTFTVTVAPASSSYTTMSLDANYNDYISAGEHIWYKYTPDETCYYEIESFGSSDTYAILYYNATIQEWNDDAGEGSNFKILTRLTEGNEYRLLVKGFSNSVTGSFQVKIKKAWPDANQPTILSREAWGAEEVIEGRLVARSRAPQRLIFHHSADKFSSTEINDVIAEIQRIQNFHMEEKNKCDIAYHFIIDPAGRIWEGAKIDDNVRGHTEGYWDDIGVVILGDFEDRIGNSSPNTLNNQQKNAMKALSQWLCYEYNLLVYDPLTNSAPINIHGDLCDTECPGDNAETWIKNNLRQFIQAWRQGV